MFPTIERELAKNKFFKAWKENSAFEGLLDTPPILVKEFSEKWVKDFKKLVGDGPMTYRFLVNLADYVEKICCLDGYSHIKERLLRLDDQLHPTIVEMEFIWFLLLKTPPQKMHLEFTFQSSTGENPELMVDSPFGPVYFEVTSVENYGRMNELLQYFNSLTAFQLSLKVLYGINRRINVSFSEYPTEKTLQCIYKDMNEFANKGQFLFKKEEPKYTVEMTEGIDVAFNLPTNDMEKKIKDKIEEKTAKFAKGDRNYIAIDVTPMLADIDVQLAKISEYFRDSENKTVWGVLLQSKAWTFDGLEPVYKHKVMCQANSFIEGIKPFSTISALIPDSS